MTEADIVNDCIDIVRKYKDFYIPSENITDEINDYYDNYKDIYDSLENQFIIYVKETLNECDYLKQRYRVYGKKELKYWFLENENFKKSLVKIRNLSNLEYYVYINNKIYNKKIEKLESKINYLLFVFIISVIIHLYRL